MLSNNKAYISLGDYNGDGRTDLLATPMEDADWTGWLVQLYWSVKALVMMDPH